MKPKPGFWRWRNILLLAFGVPLLVFCVWGAWAVHWAFNAQPGNAVDYTAKMHELGATRQAADQSQPNKWREFISLLETCNLTTRKYYNDLPTGRTPPEDWPEEFGWPPSPEFCTAPDATDAVMVHSRAMVEAYRAQEVFATLDAMRDHRRFERTFPTIKLVDIQLPELGLARSLARASVARMRLAHLDGNDVEAATAFEGMMLLARATGRQTMLIDQLVGVSICALALEELRIQLGERPHSPQALLQFNTALAAMAQDPSSRIDFSCERIIALDTIQWTHTDDGNGDGRFIPLAAQSLSTMSGNNAPAVKSPFANLSGFLRPTMKETTRVFDDYYDLLIADTQHLPEDRSLNSDAWIEALPKAQVLPRMLMPPADKAIRTFDIHQLYLGGTRIMIALELYKQRDGDYPDHLDQLIPEFLHALPIDPWNRNGLVYRRNANSVRGYALYSMGFDGEDNGGAFDPMINQNALNSYYGVGKDFNLLDVRETKKR